MVDASIGGKNGIDVGVYKNMVGIIRQPRFILHDMVFPEFTTAERMGKWFCGNNKTCCDKGCEDV
jgi:3-dehydroquinate synthase